MKIWNQRVKSIIKEFFPEKRKEILILTAFLPVIWLLSLWAEDNEQIKVLSRPGFQEKEQRITLSYEYQGKPTFADTMSITLKQHPEKIDIIQQKLKQSAVAFRNIILDKKNFKHIRKPLNLPDKWQQTEVSYSIIPENLLLAEGDWNYFELFEKEKKREIIIGVTLTYQEENVFFEEKISIQASDFEHEYIQTLLRKQLKKQVEFLQEEKASELVLPTEIEGGRIKWRPLQKKIDFKKMLVFLFLFLVMMSMLSRATAKEKERQRKRTYLRDFGQMLHHLVLLLKCGKSPYSAIVGVCSNNGEFSPDFQVAMEKCYQKIYHQEKMKAAIAVFNEQCSIPEIRRFEQLFLMAYERGDEWSIYYLEQFRDEIFAKRLREVNEYMQKATSRLVFPMVLFLIVIIIVTIVPAFEGM